MSQHRQTPTALEANVVKVRALEMILIIFYMEDLRRFIIKAINVADKLPGADDIQRVLDEDDEEGSSKTVEQTIQNMPDRLAGVFAKLRSGQALNEEEIMMLAGHSSSAMTNVYYADRN